MANKSGECSRRAFLSRSGAAASLVVAAPSIAVATGAAGAAFLEMEREINAGMERWRAALAEHTKAEDALYGPKSADFDRDAAEAWVDREAEICDAIGEEVDKLAERLVAMPAANLADLACKARVSVLTRPNDCLDEAIVDELVSMTGRGS